MSMLNERRYRLLIVEDEPTDAMLLLKELKSHIADLRIEHATNGTDALTYLMGDETKTGQNREMIPHLILMDLKLPGLSGFELLAKVKATDILKEVPVVVLTSSSESKDVRKAFSTGANSYLVKPNTYSEVSSLAKKVLQYWLSLDQSSAT